MQRVFIFILLIVCSLYAYSQNYGSVSGRIVDRETGAPLMGAGIIYGQGRGTVSDTDGNFHLQLLEGRYTLSVHFLGFRNISRTVNIRTGESIVWNVSLEQEVTQIDQVIISAGRAEQRIGESVVSVSVIKPRALSAGHINHPTELLNRTPGIEVLDGQASIRGGSGFAYGAGSRVMALLDGMPMIAPDAGNIRWDALPMENISQIEIIKGASSVLYGSSALNGVIHFRSADATPVGVTTFFAETGFYNAPRQRNWLWWDSPRIFASYSFSHLKRYNNTDIGVGLFMANDPGYRKRNDELMGRVNLRLRHHNARISGLSYGLNTNAIFNNKIDFLLWEDANTGALIHDLSTVTRLNARLLYIDPFVSFRPDTRQSHDLRARVQLLSNYFPGGQQVGSDVNAVFAEYQYWRELNSIFNLNTGVSQQTSFIRSDFYGNHQSFNLAGYVQVDANPLERLQLVAGIRLEHNSLNNESDPAVLLLRGGVNYRLTGNTFLRASFGQGYRHPSIAEKYAATTLGAVRIFANPGINPEKGWNAELGLRRGILTDRLDGLIDLSLFYTQNRDMIEFLFGHHFDPISNSFGLGFQANNTENSRVYGAEFEFRLLTRVNGINYSLNGGYIFVFPTEFNPQTLQNTGVFLKYRRKHSARLNLSATYRKLELNFNIIARSRILNIDDIFINPATHEDILPGFLSYWQQNNRGHILSDVSIAYHFDHKYSISLAIKNLTNEEYMGRPGDIQPPRHFSVRVSGRL